MIGWAVIRLDEQWYDWLKWLSFVTLFPNNNHSNAHRFSTSKKMNIQNCFKQVSVWVATIITYVYDCVLEYVTGWEVFFKKKKACWSALASKWSTWFIQLWMEKFDYHYGKHKAKFLSVSPCNLLEQYEGNALHLSFSPSLRRWSNFSELKYPTFTSFPLDTNRIRPQ